VYSSTRALILVEREVEVMLIGLSGLDCEDGVCGVHLLLLLLLVVMRTLQRTHGHF
jgi:hypothetical protein